MGAGAWLRRPRRLLRVAGAREPRSCAAGQLAYVIS